MKDTAVEWLIQEILKYNHAVLVNNPDFEVKIPLELLLHKKEQALEKEKDQIVEGFKDGYITSMLDLYRNTSLINSASEDYYNKQFQ